MLGSIYSQKLNMQGLQKFNYYSKRKVEVCLEMKVKVVRTRNPQKGTIHQVLLLHTHHIILIRLNGRLRTAILGWLCSQTVKLIYVFLLVDLSSVAKLKFYAKQNTHIRNRVLPPHKNNDLATESQPFYNKHIQLFLPQEMLHNETKEVHLYTCCPFPG